MWCVTDAGATGTNHRSLAKWPRVWRAARRFGCFGLGMLRHVWSLSAFFGYLSSNFFAHQPLLLNLHCFPNLAARSLQQSLHAIPATIQTSDADLSRSVCTLHIVFASFLWLKPLSTRGWHFLSKDYWLKMWNFLCTSCRHAVATVEVEGGDQNILSFTEFGEWWTDRSPLFNIMAEKIGVACLYAVTCGDIAWLSHWCIKKSVTCFQNAKVPRCLVAG